MSSQPSTSGLVHAYVLDGKGGARSIDWDGVAAWKPADGVLWMNLDYSQPDAQHWLANDAHLDPIVYEALLDTDPRPRAVRHEEAVLLIIRGINVNAGAEPEDMVSVRCWFESSRVITLRHRQSRSVKSIATDLERKVGPRSPGQLLASLVDRIVEHVATLVDTLGDDIAAAEDQALGDSRNAELRHRLAVQRRRAIGLRRFLAPQREALAKLAVIEVPLVGATDRGHLAQDADRMMRTVEELDAARDRAAITQEEMETRLTELTNQRLYVLSIMTAIFLPLGFVCSLLGVNVGGVPLQGVGWAFWALVGLFVIGVAIQLWIFRRRGWLGRR